MKLIMNNYQDKEVDRFQNTTTLFIVDDPTNIDELEQEWDDYNSMPKDHRRMSDWKSQELFGMNNKDRYDKLKSNFLKTDDYDVSDIPLESGIVKEEVKDDPVDFENINYPEEAVQQAITWSINSSKVIIRPMDTLDKLEDLWLNWNQMHLKHRRESDWKSEELFGVINKVHYEYLKSAKLKEDIKSLNHIDAIDINTIDNLTESKVEKLCRSIRDCNNILESTSMCLELSNIQNTSYSDEILIKSTLDDTMELFKNNVTNVLDIKDLPNDLPFFDPYEMDSLGVFNKDTNRYSVDADNDELYKGISIKEWYDKYKLLFHGVYTEDIFTLSNKWVDKLNALYEDYDYIKSTNDIDRINARKQSILELGWNPEIDFNSTTRNLARNRICSYMNKLCENQFIDYTEFALQEKYDTIKDEHPVLFPIYIILLEGKSVFGSVVRKVSHSEYSHSAIGFDSTLDKLYSFNMNGARGLSYEKLKNYNPESKVSIFAIFVKDKDLRTINRSLDYYVLNKERTRYSYLNVITMPFQIPLNFNLKMICSQFVDRILKMADIDITNKDSATVYPNDFYLKSKTNNKIYNIFKGKIKEYDHTKTDKLLKSIKGKELYIKEFTNNIIDESSYIQSICENINNLDNLKILDEKSNLLNEKTKQVYDTMVKPYLYLNEVKEFPIQFDEDGNLLIQRIGSIDFEAEYSQIHKLLLLYSKSNDIESIKYELSKLWFLNNVIESRLYNKLYKNDREDLLKARAKILNDYNKYLTLVLKKEKTFNFTEYYNNTPFSDATYKINRSTLSFVKQQVVNLVKLNPY